MIMEKGQFYYFEVKNIYGSGGIRTHAPEETGALNQRLRPLGHATFLVLRKHVTHMLLISYLLQDFYYRISASPSSAQG